MDMSIIRCDSLSGILCRPIFYRACLVLFYISLLFSFIIRVLSECIVCTVYCMFRLSYGVINDDYMSGDDKLYSLYMHEVGRNANRSMLC